MPEIALAPGPEEGVSAADAVIAGMPVAQVVALAAARLERCGCETPRLDAELLVGAALGVGRERLVLDSRRRLQGAEADRARTLIERRCRREPVAYILGRRDFRHLSLAVDPRVLIPRPETELLVEVGLTLPHGARVLDLGTGSGAVALALRQERPDLKVWGSDLSADALQVARENARALGLEVRLVQADLLAGVGERFDAVLANLPYVASGAELAPEIAGHEPPEALFAGPDGLAVIRRLVCQLSPAAGGRGEGLTSGPASVPLVALEVGFDQAEAVEALLRASGFESVQRLRDLAGHERVLVGRRT